MGILGTIAIIFICLVLQAVAVFIFGPSVLELVVDKIEEWEGIFDSLKEEK